MNERFKESINLMTKPLKDINAHIAEVEQFNKLSEALGDISKGVDFKIDMPNPLGKLLPLC